ncbi:MAG: 4'-phosphopantetheinyl transferase superfamily protein [Clostridiales bacterium]|nr:4'-phosphopantetheinyl transferase superfamily protein [Clostridiales bacterium]
MMIRIFSLKVTGLDFTEERFWPYLSQKRLREAADRKQEKERQLFLGAEVLLNRSLEALDMDISIPAEYERNSHGKPYLKERPTLYVNWSHSEEYVICGISDREIGIDLQYSQKEVRESLLRRALRPSEQELLRRADEKEQQRLFYVFWTLKESFLKALGTGFYTSLEQFCVHLEQGGPWIEQQIDEKCYGCALLDFPDPDYVAAVCVEGDLPSEEILTIREMEACL